MLIAADRSRKQNQGNDIYRTSFKIWTPKCYCECPRNATAWSYVPVLRPKIYRWNGNNVDPDLTSLRSSLTWFCTLCFDLSDLIIRIFSVQRGLFKNPLQAQESLFDTQPMIFTPVWCTVRLKSLYF